MLSRRLPALAAAFALAAGALLVPGAAAAQWRADTYTGGNHTRPATVTIDQPSRLRLLHFEDVSFEARPLESPQYYGARLGYFFREGRLGLEAEFLHIKVISQTGETVRVTGAVAGTPVDLRVPMNGTVQRYNMTHGLNFFLVNVAVRVPVAAWPGPRPAAVAVRAGAGPVVAGVDAVVDHVSQQGYHRAGAGAQVAAGVDLPVWRRLSAIAEYKFTAARPRIPVDGGTGRMRARTHHVAIGFGISFEK